MARKARDIGEGSWHHVYNRAIARRPLFESAQDIRYFLSRIARCVRRGELEVHAYSVLTTHYHLLVCCPDGRLSAAMQRVQTEYTRFFNRRRRRDGPLVRGRYGSRLVEEVDYRHLLVGYIDRNPVAAGLCVAPWDYPYGSARHYIAGGGAPWLDRSWIEPTVCRRCRVERCDARSYGWIFHGILDRSDARQIGSGRSDDLLSGLPDRVRAWMERKAALADGTAPGAPIARRTSVHDAVEAASLASAVVLPNRKRRPLRQVLLVALRRDLCGDTFTAIGDDLGITGTTCTTIYRQHVELLRSDTTYAAQVANLAADAIARSGAGEANP